MASSHNSEDQEEHSYVQYTCAFASGSFTDILQLTGQPRRWSLILDTLVTGNLPSFFARTERSIPQCKFPHEPIYYSGDRRIRGDLCWNVWPREVSGLVEFSLVPGIKTGHRGSCFWGDERHGPTSSKEKTDVIWWSSHLECELWKRSSLWTDIWLAEFFSGSRLSLPLRPYKLYLAADMDLEAITLYGEAASSEDERKIWNLWMNSKTCWCQCHKVSKKLLSRVPNLVEWRLLSTSVSPVSKSLGGP